MAVEESWLKAHHDLEQARYEFDRDNELFKEGIIARQRLQQTRRRLQQVEFTLASPPATTHQGRVY